MLCSRLWSFVIRNLRLRYSKINGIEVGIMSRIMSLQRCICDSPSHTKKVGHRSQPLHIYIIWWRHQMKTFCALQALCAGNSPGTGEFPAQRPVTRSFDVFFDLRRNKRLSKQSWGWWFETLSCPLLRHRNEQSNNTLGKQSTVHRKTMEALT